MAHCVCLSFLHTHTHKHSTVSCLLCSTVNRLIEFEISKRQVLCMLLYFLLIIHREVHILVRRAIYKKQIYLWTSLINCSYRFECSSLTDKHRFVAAWTNNTGSFALTSVPSNSSRKCKLGWTSCQTLDRFGWFVRITSPVRPARVPLRTHVKNN